MKWLVDLNVILDVIQQRAPFYDASARVISRIVQGHASGCLAGHEVTTAYYIVRRYVGRQAADDLVDWLLNHFEILPEGKIIFERARLLNLPDFEDAAIASAAQEAGCDHIVTRNERHFIGSPVPATSPTDLLSKL